jgi:hypothetical protein
MDFSHVFHILPLHHLKLSFSKLSFETDCPKNVLHTGWVPLTQKLGTGVFQILEYLNKHNEIPLGWNLGLKMNLFMLHTHPICIYMKLILYSSFLKNYCMKLCTLNLQKAKVSLSATNMDWLVVWVSLLFLTLNLYTINKQWSPYTCSHACT